MARKHNNDIFEKAAKLKLKERQMRKIKKYTKKRVIIPILVIFALFMSTIAAAIHSKFYQSTDDAFVEGRLVSIAPKASGHILKLYFDDNEYVEKGQLLIEIDDRDYQNKVKELEGAVKEAKALSHVSSLDTEKFRANFSESDKNVVAVKEKLDFNKKDYERYTSLMAQGLCTKQELDSARTKYNVSLQEYKQALDRKKAMGAAVKSSKSSEESNIANIEKLTAQLEQAKLDLSYTKIYAPNDGFIATRSIEEGNYVQVGQPVCSLVPDDVWVVANFKETQLTNMKKGQSVDIKVDVYPNVKFKGVVDSIQRASGAKASLLPPENAVGSYVKVVQRIPVKIKFTSDIKGYDLAPGMSVVPKVKIK